MPQEDYDIAAANRTNTRTDINNHLLAIVGLNSGSSEPTTKFSYQLWADSTADPAIIKIRNAANNAWASIFDSDGNISTSGSGTFNSLVVTTTTTLNNAGGNSDTQIKGLGDDNLLYIDAGNDRIGISTNAPQATFEILIDEGTVWNASSTSGQISSGTTMVLKNSNNTPNSFCQIAFFNRVATVGICRIGSIKGPSSGQAQLAFVTDPGTNPAEAMRIDEGQRIGIGSTNPSARLHIIQGSTAAQPVLLLNQTDVSEEMIEFVTTIATGNPIEAIAAKTLTTTHFIKITIPGGLTRYIPCGTIA